MEERKYVIVNNEYTTWPKGSLLFWGHYTEDDQQRSFGGYTTRFDQCEKYTRTEVERWRAAAVDHYPFFDEIKPTCAGDFLKYEDVVCTLEDLHSLGWALWQIVVRP